MKTQAQFGMVVLTLAGALALASGSLAQKPHNNPPAPAPHPTEGHAQNHDANRPPYARSNTHPNANTNPNANRPPQNYAPAPPPRENFNAASRPHNGNTPNLSQRQQLGMGAARPWVDTMRDLTPQQREHVLQNSKAFQNLSPDKQAKIRQQFNQWDRMTSEQQASLRQNEAQWLKLTPEQRQHIKNDVLPKWKQMPWDRQQVIKQKLGVLQNMPEAARNQRLSDPNFTRGMSDDEKSMLRDLSHTHVGGPPENPPE